MAVRKREAPRVSHQLLLAAALRGRDALAAFSEKEFERVRQERINWLLKLAEDLGLGREKFQSDQGWLFELAFRLASDQYASTGDRGRPHSPFSDADFDLCLRWEVEKKERKKGVTERSIAMKLVETVQPWASQFDDKLAEELAKNKNRSERLARQKVKGLLADNLRKRYRRIVDRLKK